jgi:hypothetical protein
MDQNLFEQWETAAADTGISTTTIDLAVRDYVEARREYEEAKTLSNDKHAVMEEKEFHMQSLLEQAGKSKYHVDGIGTVQTISKLTVQTPKTPEDKAKLFTWLKNKLGADGFLTYVSVNHNSLNSLYKNMFEEATDKATFSIDGIGQPVERKEIRFTKQK